MDKKADVSIAKGEIVSHFNRLHQLVVVRGDHLDATGCFAGGEANLGSICEDNASLRKGGTTHFRAGQISQDADVGIKVGGRSSNRMIFGQVLIDRAMSTTDPSNVHPGGDHGSKGGGVLGCRTDGGHNFCASQ